jgi:hypothetical protein
VTFSGAAAWGCSENRIRRTIVGPDRRPGR